MTRNNSLTGIAAMLVSAAAFVANDTFMKLSIGSGLPPMEVLVLRNVPACLWCLGALGVMGLFGQLHHAVNRWVLARAALETIALACFIQALARMPIGDVTAISQIAPLLLVLAAGVFGSERIGPVQMGLVACGFLGALLVAQPGAASASAAAPLAFGAALFIALRDLAGRNIPAVVPPLVSTFSTLMMVLVLALAGSWALETPVPPSQGTLLLLAGTGLLLMLGHLFIFMAFRHASVGTLAPFYYSFTVAAVVAQLLVFGQVPNGLAMLGIALIVGSGVAVIAYEEQRRRSAGPAPAA